MTESTSLPFTVPELPMQTQTIREYLPHRYPFLLVDRVTEVTENGDFVFKNILLDEGDNNFSAIATSKEAGSSDGSIPISVSFDNKVPELKLINPRKHWINSKTYSRNGHMRKKPSSLQA